MRTYVVVGGGPAGLAAAYRLSASRDSVLLIERAPVTGGLAAGFQHGGFVLDYGPHRLHTQTDPAVLADLRTLLGSELELRRRHGVIHLGGRSLPYPTGPSALLALGFPTAARLTAGLLAARLHPSRPAPSSYEAALLGRVGAPLYHLFYEPYAEKVWGLPGAEIAADQADLRVNQRGIGDMVRLLTRRGPGARYYYPRGGFGRIPAAYAAALAGRPNVDLHTSASVQGVRWENGAVRSVSFSHEDLRKEVPADGLLWSAPLPELLRVLDPPPPPRVTAAAHALRSRALVLYYLVLPVGRVGKADTYYFPERRFPFNRVTEQKNFSAATAPADRTVLGMDIACSSDSPVFAASDSDLLALVTPALRSAGLLGREPPMESFSRRFHHAYPVYDLRYATALSAIEEWLQPFSNLYLMGRQGLFLHNNTHHSLLMGYRAAAAALSGDHESWRRSLVEFRTFRVAD